MWHIYPNPDIFHSLQFKGEASDSLAESKLFAMPGLIGDRWRVPKVEVSIAEKQGDYPSYHGGIPPVFSERALKILHNYLVNCEILELDILGHWERAYKIVVPPIIDCLDQDKAIVRRFKTSNRIMSIEKYAFTDLCKSNHIFRIPEETLSQIFVSDIFKETVEINGLEGFIFKKVPLLQD